LVEHFRNASKTSAGIVMDETYSLRLNGHLELANKPQKRRPLLLPT